MADLSNEPVRLKRKPLQYAHASPNAIANGSRAQMMYFVEDAKADISTLLDALEAERSARVRLEEALRPFVSVKDQFPETLKLIQPKFDGFSPITVTVTKDQYISAVKAFAALSSEQGSNRSACGSGRLFRRSTS